MTPYAYLCDSVSSAAARGLNNGVYNETATSACVFSSPTKAKGQSLGLMMEGTRVARVMRGSPASLAGLQVDICCSVLQVCCRCVAMQAARVMRSPPAYVVGLQVGICCRCVADVLQVCCDASGVCDAQLACVCSRETFSTASPPPDRLHTRTIDILKSELKSDFA